MLGFVEGVCADAAAAHTSAAVARKKNPNRMNLPFMVLLSKLNLDPDESSDVDRREALDLGHRHRAGEQEPLPVWNSQGLEDAQLFTGFDALGDDFGVHLAR